MREVQGGSQISGPDLGYSSSHSIFHPLCQEWLMRIELDLTDSEITFEAVKWAISKLQCIEEQECYQGYDSTQGIAGSSSSRFDDERGIWVSGQSPNKLRSGVSENFAGEDGVGNGHGGSTTELVSWRNMLIEAGGCINEPQQGGVRARVRKFVFSTALKEAVIAAEGGEAGRRMAERINSRLDLPDCVFLIKLVNHCLLVSLDQTPTNAVRAALASHSRSSSMEHEETSDCMWLHIWFVRSLLPGRSNDSSYIALDWLVAYMTASRGTITKLVLHDLIVDLQSLNDGDEQPPVATYIRQTGVLEYAALRDEATHKQMAFFTLVDQNRVLRIMFSKKSRFGGYRSWCTESYRSWCTQL